MSTAKNRVTIRDVAKKARVSPGTVSRAMHNSPLVHGDTRQRIMSVVDELGYVPNIAARRLSLGSSQTLSLAIPAPLMDASVRALNGAIRVLAQNEHELVIHGIESEPERSAFFRTVPNRQKTDGVLVFSLLPIDREIISLASADVPIVFVDVEHHALSLFHTVTTDNGRGGELATQHLIDLGHQRIGFFGYEVENETLFSTSRARFFGFLKAMRAAGLRSMLEYHARVEPGCWQDAYTKARIMLDLPMRPTAILAGNVQLAMSVVKAAQSVGLCVPHDLSIMGYDDDIFANLADLTTIRQSLSESGALAAKILLDHLDKNGKPAVHEVLAPELVIRNTTTYAPPLINRSN